MTVGYLIYIIGITILYCVSTSKGFHEINDIYCIVGLFLLCFSKITRINILMEERRAYNKRSEERQKNRMMRNSYNLSIPMLIIVIIGLLAEIFN